MIIGTIKKNAFDSIVVQTTEFKGHEYVDVRVHYQDDNGDLKPTKKGIAVAPEFVDKVIDLLQKASAEIKQEFESE